MKNGKLLFYTACLGMLLFGMVMTTMGSILPSLIDKFSLDEMGAGTLVSLLPLGILAGSLIFGPVADRYGYQFLLFGAALVEAMALEGIGFLPGMMGLRIAVFSIGLGGGILNGATNALVADISEEQKGASLSLLGVFYGVGALSMPTLLNVLKNSFSTSIILGSIGFFVGLASFLFLGIRFPKPKQQGGFPQGEVGQLLRSPLLWVGGMFLFFMSGLEGLVNNWTTTYLMEIISVDKGKALSALSALVLSLTLARILIGGPLKKFPPHKLMLISLGLAFFSVLILYFSRDYAVFLLGIILLGGGMSTGFPVMLGYIGEKFSSLSGTAFGVVLVLALLGNTLINLVMGWIADHQGLQTLFPMAGFCIGAMGVLFLAFIRKGRNNI